MPSTSSRRETINRRRFGRHAVASLRATARLWQDAVNKHGGDEAMTAVTRTLVKSRTLEPIRRSDEDELDGRIPNSEGDRAREQHRVCVVHLTADGLRDIHGARSAGITWCSSVSVRASGKPRCVRTVSDPPKPRSNSAIYRTRGSASLLLEGLEGNCVAAFRCASARLAGIYFQAHPSTTRTSLGSNGINSLPAGGDPRKPTVT